LKNKRKNRSDTYQHIILESVFPNEMLESFSNDESLYNRLNPYAYDERVVELEDQLKDEFWRIVSQLTPRQQEVIKLYASGKTQMEIAKKLNVNQSSITKSINGNVDYKNGKKCYGGAKKKLQKLAESDNKIKDLLNQINELRELKW
jgi:FixJ family two-component response regulator